MRLQHLKLLWIALFFVANSSWSQGLPNSVEKPDFKLGDYWVYNKLDGGNGNLIDVISEEIIKIDDNGYRLTATEGFGTFTTTVFRNSNFNKTREEGDKKYLYLTKPYYPHFAFPLNKGKSWKQRVELTWSTASDVKIVFDGLESKVLGWELITVPAGTFWTLKIESTGWNNGTSAEYPQWSGKVTETRWFAPYLRNVIRSEYLEKISGRTYKHEITELRSFGLTP